MSRPPFDDRPEWLGIIHVYPIKAELPDGIPSAEVVWFLNHCHFVLTGVRPYGHEAVGLVEVGGRLWAFTDDTLVQLKKAQKGRT